ncbi:YtxH domain-containing protein [Polaribacter glomeratus]|nr:YtxH domain-containing protein [Polaribacter glomeratus]TXD65821.1 YtxH domain-containing protein [Polaribacter glomeratus]
MKINNRIKGLLVGLVIGATAGILIAPEKGLTTRNIIKSKVKKTKNKLR